MIDKDKTVSLLLRIGLFVVFVYAGISALMNPSNWIWFVPQWIDIFISRDIFLMIHGITDLIIGLWVVSNFKPFYSGLIASLSLIGIILGNVTQLDIIFRDIGILFASLAFMVFNYRKN